MVRLWCLNVFTSFPFVPVHAAEMAVLNGLHDGVLSPFFWWFFLVWLVSWLVGWGLEVGGLRGVDVDLGYAFYTCLMGFLGRLTHAGVPRPSRAHACRAC